MIVVSDASPLNFLLRLGRAELLPKMFGEILIPSIVREEMSRLSTPVEVREALAHPPAWLHVREPVHIEPIANLDPGETAAISLALEVSADLILVDDGDARNAARARGLSIIGLLGVLDRADEFGLIDLASAATSLPKDYRISKALLASVVERFVARRAPPR